MNNNLENAATTAKEILKLYHDIERLESGLRSELRSSFESQLAFARLLDISPQYLNDILRDRRGFSLDTLKAITKLKRSKINR